MIDGKIAKTATDQEAPCLFESIADVLRSMGIRAESNEFPSELPVASEDILRRIGMPQTIPESGSVAFQRLALFDQRTEDGVDIILIAVIGIILVRGGAITDYIVQVSEGVKAIQTLGAFERYLKIPFIGTALASTLKKGGIIRIHPVNKMAGSDNKIHIERAGEGIQIIPDMVLQAQLDADGDPDAAGVFFTQAVKTGKIGGKIQKEKLLFHAGIVIMVIRDADFLHAHGDTTLNLYRYGGGAVAGKCGMNVSIGEHRMPDLLIK